MRSSLPTFCLPDPGLRASADSGARPANEGSFELLRGLLETRTNHPALVYFRPLRRFKEMAERCYTEPLSLAQAARTAGLETKYFSTYFRRKVGITFSSWLMMRRTLTAMTMMEETDHTITDIALSVGLEICTFERWFKRLTGVSPRTYRNRHPRFTEKTSRSAGRFESTVL